MLLGRSAYKNELTLKASKAMGGYAHDALFLELFMYRSTASRLHLSSRTIGKVSSRPAFDKPESALFHGIGRCHP